MNDSIYQKLVDLSSQKKNSKPAPLLGVDWKIESAQESDILFYKINNEEGLKVFLEKMKNRKISLVVVNNFYPEISVLDNFLVIENNNWLQAQKIALDAIYPMESNLKFVGITGTNGKTSTAFFLQQVLNTQKISCVTIGTLGVWLDQKKFEDFSLTSPSYIDFRKTVFKYQKDSKIFICEVSSHALDQKRFYEIKWDDVGWLSFSQDHLDYHQSLENYFDAKMLITKSKKSSTPVILPASQRDLADKVEKGYAIELAKVPGTDWENKNALLKSHFNRDNLSVALTLAEKILQQKDISFDVTTLKEVPGRFSVRRWQEKVAVIDFAHTPDALDNICLAIKSAFPGFKLNVLFGCGGDRDRTKRPLMARVVEKYADKIYLTSDNPRTENPLQIMQDALAGVANKNKVQMEVERAVMVQKALGELQNKEVLLMAGKGHENYIIRGTTKHFYSDYDELEKFLMKVEK
jgi:UDP-N-acetylmuramoyl-L-alanyl-D-glutamate--2,6-diaminopimelate ligase